MKKIKRIFKFKPFSKKQRMVLNWWCKDSPVKDSDGIRKIIIDIMEKAIETVKIHEQPTILN